MGYVGLARSVNQSGYNFNAMVMSPRAQRLIRSYFLEASWQAIRADPVMQAYYGKHTYKNVKSIIIKVARAIEQDTGGYKNGDPCTIGVVE
jgi:hypothetical protein